MVDLSQAIANQLPYLRRYARAVSDHDPEVVLEAEGELNSAPATAVAQDPMDADLDAQEADDDGMDWGWIGLLGLAGLLGLRRRDHVDHTTTRNPRV